MHTLFANARAAIFYFGSTVAAFTTATLMAIVGPFSMRARYYFLAAQARFMLFLLKMCCGVRYVVHGRENLIGNPAVFLSKHQSSWETIAFMLVLPKQSFVLKKELLDIPILGFGLKSMEPISIDRSRGRNALRDVIAQGLERLSRGRSVTIFPEGSRIPPGQRGRYQKSGAQLAINANVPVIPIAHNSGVFWQHGAFRKFPGTITMIIGQAIDSRGKNAAELTRQVEDWIEDTVKTLPTSASNAV